jgi:hypothetical protein
VENLRDKSLDGATNSVLSKGLNFAVSSLVLPIEDILGGVKDISKLPVEVAEDVREETPRILKVSKKPRNNLSRAEEQTLFTLRGTADLTFLPADRGNATVVLNTTD